MALKTTAVDISELIGTPEAQAEFIAAAFESGDRAHIGRAIGEVARARGMTAIAKDAGLSREALYRALSEDGDPRLSTLLGVMKALGLHLAAAPPSGLVKSRRGLSHPRRQKKAKTADAGASRAS